MNELDFVKSGLVNCLDILDNIYVTINTSGDSSVYGYSDGVYDVYVEISDLYNQICGAIVRAATSGTTPRQSRRIRDYVREF